MKKKHDESSVADHTSPSQRLPRPLSYRSPLLRPRILLLSLVIALVLVVIVGTTVTIFRHLGATSVTRTPTAIKTLIPTPTPTSHPTPTSTPTLIPTSVPTPLPNFLPTSTPTIPTTPSGILTWATSGQPFINDRLQFQDGNSWSENPNSVRSCQFSGGTYHASVSIANNYVPCLALAGQDSNLQNIAFQVQVTIIKGDAGGLVFHSNASGADNYSFTFCINAACGQGYYGLYIGQNMHYSHIVSGFNPAIKTGLNQTNLLTVVVLNGAIYLYINNQYLNQVQDNTFSSGYIGVTAYEGSNSTDVSFSNAEVWKLQG